MVARMYSTVLSNSFSESAFDLADLPHDQVHYLAGGPTICRVKSCMQAMRSATVMVGHTPRPSS